jgi:hypothetical protein
LGDTIGWPHSDPPEDEGESCKRKNYRVSHGTALPLMGQRVLVCNSSDKICRKVSETAFQCQFREGIAVDPGMRDFTFSHAGTEVAGTRKTMDGS